MAAEEEKNMTLSEEERRLWTVSVSPHVKGGESVEKIMWTVVACLIPALAHSVFVFGLQVLLITLITVASCMACEAVSQKLLHRPVTIKDGSAAVTGMLLAFALPPDVPYWLPILGAVVAVYVAKQLLGGIGYNIFNPALIGRAFLVATFPVAMTSQWVAPLGDASVLSYMGTGYDAVSTATPLYLLKFYGIEGLVEKYGSLANVYKEFILGNRPGCIGASSILLVFLGGLYLLYKRYITWHIPVSVIGTVMILYWAFGGDTLFTGNPLVAVLSGAVIVGAFFYATDYVTSPTQPKGKILFGIGVGALTVLIRLKGGYPEGVAYAILLMNPLTPAFEEWFGPKRFAPPKGAEQ